MANNDINLIKNQSQVSTHLGDYEKITQKTAWWGLLLFLIVGLLVGSIYFYARVSLSQLEAENNKLNQAISAQNIKEGILLSLKTRTEIAQKALESVRPWGLLFPLLLRIAPAQVYNSFTVDILGHVTTTMQVDSIEEAITITRSAIVLSEEKLIKNPQLSSLIIKDDGKVTFGISFIPTF